ncbi:MAG TPA: D-2-hydroxyacid dehydrogenase [Lachnospiraceae bacterium]|nr:D-2-hydroxyacid dehydrogenase [Lachnospiraceae bacterium]
MKIVALERINVGYDVDVSRFHELGEFIEYDFSTADQIKERGQGAEILVINKLPMNENTLRDLTELKLICVTATGTDNVDVDYCKSRGISVCNVKGYSTASVVQHTFAVLFYVFEKLNYYDAYVKSGDYTKNAIYTHFDEHFCELRDKTWGIIGLGEIGRGVAKAAEAFGCKVIYYSTSGKNSTTDYKQVDFDTLLAASDIISIHAPLNDSTRNLMTLDAFKKMKETAYLINMGRGPIINEADLVEALEQNLIAGAGLDVLSAEPMRTDNPLLRVKDSKKLLITPHIAWATTEARTRLMEEVRLNIEAYIKGEKRGRVC